MSICPNKNLPEWKALVAEVGSFEAFRDFMETNGEIRDPQTVAAKLKEQPGNVVYQIERPGTGDEPLNREILESMLENLKGKFGDGKEYKYAIVNDPEGNWKGRVKYPAKNSTDSPTIEINASKATLDTPLHEYGHIFIDMIRVNNMRLYFNLLKNFENEAEFKEALAYVKSEYAGMAGYDEARMMDEALVHLLGEAAAGLVNPNTGTYNLIQTLWNEIKKYIKEIFEQDGKAKVNVLDLQPGTPIASLAHMLANKDLLIDYGTDRHLEKDIKKQEVKLAKFENSKNKIRNAGDIRELGSFYWKASDVEYENEDEGLIILYDKATQEKIKKYVDRWDDIQGYVTEKLITDSNKFYDWLGEQSGTYQEIYSRLKANPDFTWWKWVALSNSDIVDGLVHDIKNQARGESSTQAKERVTSRLLEIKEIFDTTPTRDIFGQAITGRNKDLRELLGIEGIFSGIGVKGTTPLQLFANENRKGEAIRQYLRDLQSKRKTDYQRETRSFLYTSKHPDTGVVTKERIFVQGTLNNYNSGRTVSVNFWSAKPTLDKDAPYGSWGHNDEVWGYGDAFILRDPNTVDIVRRRLATSGRKQTEVAYMSDPRQFDDPTTDLSERGRSRALLTKIEGDNVWIDFVVSNNVPYMLEDQATTGVNNQKTIVKVPMSKIRVIQQEANRGLKVMGQVTDAVNSIAFGQMYDAITFSAAGDSSIKYKVRKTMSIEEFRRMFPEYNPSEQQTEYLKIDGLSYEAPYSLDGVSTVTLQRVPSRKELYPLFGRSLFGSKFAVGTTQERVIIPSMYTPGFNLGMDMYQTDRDKIADMPAKEDANTLQGNALMNTQTPTDLDVTNTEHVRAIEFANKLSEQLGIDYQIITEKEAQELTKDAKNPWNGEKAFFIGGRVYFVGNQLSTNMVLHEFAHPLVRAMAAENRQLFDNLFKQLMDTHDGRQLFDEVAALYPDLDTASDLFREEMIVRSLEKAGQERYDALQGDGKFNKVINNLLYAIKQFLRRVFGKAVTVSSLSPNTTINELADMLSSGREFTLDTAQISQSDVVAYVRNQEQYVKDVQNINSKEIQSLINRVYDISSKHINTLKSREEYDELAEILLDEYDTGELQELKSRVSEFQTMVANVAEETQQDMEYQKQRATAFVDTMFRLETVMEKTLAHMQDIVQDKDGEDTIGNMKKAHYYDYLVKYWETMVEEMNNAMDDPKNNIPNNSPLAQLSSNITRTISRIKALTNEMYADGARDTLYDQLAPMGESLKNRYDTMLKNMIEKGAPAKKIDRLHKQYYGVTRAEQKRMKELQAVRASLTQAEMVQLRNLERSAAKGVAITPEKIEALLKGEIGDANFFNSYLEGYLYNTDPVVGGLALFVKNAMNEVMVRAQAKYTDFSEDLKESLDKAGINFSRQGELGEKVGFVDTVTTRNKETGELEEKKVWTLLNPFQGHRADFDKYKDAVDQAQLTHIRQGTDESKAALVNAIADRQKFMRDYFHQPYVAEYYERQSLFEKDDVGKEALYRRKNLFERIRALNETAVDQSDYLEIDDELDLLWREYRQMHSQYNLDGSRKTGTELAIANRLTDYRDESRDFYEWKQRKNAFENDYFMYEQELADKGMTAGTPEYEALMKEWLKRNTRVAIKDEYYQERGRIIDRIQEILSKLPDQDRKDLDQTVLWEQIHDLAAGFRDESGQPDASQLSEGSIAEIKRLEEELIEKRKDYVSRSGLSPNQQSRLSELHQKKADSGLTPDEKTEMADLYNLRSQYGLTQWESVELDTLYEELSELSKRDATDYYADIMNNWLTKLNTDKLFLETGARTITKEGANKILEPAVLNDLLQQDAEFAEWFRANHIRKEFYNKDTGSREVKWERVYIWSVVKPSDEAFMEKYDIKDKQGRVVRTVPGLPNMKYYKRVVKDEFSNTKIVGVTADNKGQWLPKTMEQGAKDDRYQNKKYYELQQKEPALFEVLEKLTKHHLKNQEGLSHNSKLYLDFPRFRKESLEVLQTKNIKERAGEKMNALTIWAQRVKEFFYGAKDDAESGFNDKDDMNLVRADMFDNEITSVPIHGLYDIDLQDVSTDITHTMMKYMLSGERQKQLIEISPVARAVQAVVNDPKNGIKEMDKINKFNFVHRGITTYLTKKGKGVRAQAVNNFIEREFEGQRMTGATKDVKWLNNTASLLFKRASFSFFALNIPSALKNSYGAKFQAMIEASGGRYVNHATLQQGNAWAYATMGELSFGKQLYKKGAKSLRQQITEIYDPSQGRFEETFGEGMSRTIKKDIASMSWLYNFRKWVELQATLQIFGGMMYHQKVKQFEGTPQEKEVTLMDIWELRDNKIQLKEGIDPKYGITYDAEGNQIVGSEFKNFRNVMHQKMNDLQGAYAQFDQPEAQRYLGFRFISYLRRYFTTMTLNRFGFSGALTDPQPRFNPGTGEAQMGFYIEFARFMKDTLQSLGRNVQYMTPEEKQAVMKMATEVGMLVATSMLMSLLFGWDPDDEDKFAKLRDKSGALPFPMTTGDPDRDFKLWGFLENHALHLLMNIRAENEQFLPFPGLGLDDYTAMLDIKSIAFGPTMETYSQLFGDIVDIAQGNESAYYKRTVGPYKWQQEGGSKFWAHLGRTVGLTGSSLDPAKAIKGFQSVQARAR